MITELSEQTAKQFLREQSVAKLGCVLPAGEPYIVPVNYLLKDDAVYIHSLPGLKLDALRANPKACLQADEIEDNFNWRSVIAFGEFEEITAEDKRTEILHELFARFENLTPVEAQRRMSPSDDRIVVFRVCLTRINGVGES